MLGASGYRRSIYERESAWAMKKREGGRREEEVLSWKFFPGSDQMMI